MRTLFVSDLDGTLLRPDASFPKVSREGIEEILGRGVLFTLASARSVVSMRDLLGDLPIVLPTIGFNGGTVSDWSTGGTLRRATIDTAVARRIVDAATRVGIRPFISTTGEVDRLRYVESVNGGMDWFIGDRESAGDTRLARVDSLDPAFADEVLCITHIGTGDVLRPLRDEIAAVVGDGARPQFYSNPYGPAWDWLTYNGPMATKAHGIDSVIEIAGLDPDIRVVVFGDAQNDLEMFARADYAIAPANADAELLEAADEVVEANSTDAVIRWLLANA